MIPFMVGTERIKEISRDIGKNFRRKIAAKALSRIFPYRLNVSEENHQALNHLLKENTGLVVVTPHFDRGDIIRVFEALLLSFPKIRKKKMIVPVAAHQINSPGLKQLSKFADITFSSIITRDTVQKQKRLGTQQDNHKRQGEGNREYAQSAIEIIKAGGTIVVAPQGGRRDMLKLFEGNPIRTTDTFLRRAGAENFSYVFLGLERKRLFGKKETDYAKRRGMNPLHRYEITLGEIVSSQELRKKAQNNNLTVDEQARQLMLAVAPTPYIPEEDRRNNNYSARG